MEALAFLKFWRNVGAGAPSAGAVNFPAAEIDSDGDDDDEGSFFEIEFSVPGLDYERQDKKGESNCRDPVMGGGEKRDSDAGGGGGDGDGGSGSGSELCFGESKVKDLFFKNRVMPLESTSKPQSPMSLLRSPPKFRVFTMGLKRSRSQRTEKTQKTEQKPETISSGLLAWGSNHRQKKPSKLFTLKLKVEEGSVVSMLTGENSSRGSSAESKRFSKDGVQKYLKLIKPPYVRASKRFSEKVKFSETSSFASSLSPQAPSYVPKKKEAGGNIPAGLREVCKQLGKSRSASASATATSRRDDSLMLQHDGIQSAIQHCKRSFNSSADSPQLSRSTSHPCPKTSMELTRKSTEEAKVGKIAEI
ncbi:probable membrane-associated kinase regulator 2 [Malania oleifera]|uniref:probable membrane-associated kinase regulator 2 n=1 Tax=Malania oleifera TaxID=397392 RepID=UPI0025AE074B|nr:probable membrane-associated kinase regulator 2 [Malania oleifera]